MPSVPPDPAGHEVVPAGRLSVDRVGMLPASQTVPAPKMVRQ